MNKPRTYGFQFSLTDAVAICMFIGVAVALWRVGNPLWWVLVVTAAHFFLFCNVFRIVRRRELIWAGLFILNISVWVWTDNLTWTHVLLCQLPITVWFVIADMLAPSYHGVFANRLNPRLNEYLEGRIP